MYYSFIGYVVFSVERGAEIHSQYVFLLLSPSLSPSLVPTATWSCHPRSHLGTLVPTATCSCHPPSHLLSSLTATCFFHPCSHRLLSPRKAPIHSTYSTKTHRNLPFFSHFRYCLSSSFLPNSSSFPNVLWNYVLLAVVTFLSTKIVIGQVLIRHGLPRGGVCMGATVFIWFVDLFNVTLFLPAIFSISWRMRTATTDYFTTADTVVTGKPPLLRQCRQFSFSESFFSVCMEYNCLFWSIKKMREIADELWFKTERTLSYVDLLPSSGDYDM